LDDRKLDHRHVVHGQFREPGSDRPTFFEPADAIRNDTVPPIGIVVEFEREAPMPLALIAALWNDGANAVPLQPWAEARHTIAFVSSDAAWSRPRAAPRLGHPHRVHHGLELGRLLPLAGCHMGGQW